MGEHPRRRAVTQTQTDGEQETADPAPISTKLRAMTIYFQQVELIFILFVFIFFCRLAS